MTHITQGGIDDMPHLRDSPLNNVAEILVVDVVVLFPNRPLSTFLEFILTVTVPGDVSVSTLNHSCPSCLHFDQTIIRQHSNDFVQLLGLQAHPPSQIVIFKTAHPNQQDKHPSQENRERQSKAKGDQRFIAYLTATYTGCRASWSMMMVYFGS